MNALDYIANKFKIDLSTDSPIEIPNVGRNNLPEWLHDLDFKIGVEVGVAAGEYSEIICRANPQMKVYGVDPWEAYTDYKHYVKKDAFNKLYGAAKKRLAQYSNYEFIKDLSINALKKFKDTSLDFVYIDANHEDPYISEDIAEWSKKIRPGGIVAGHDYIKAGKARRNMNDAMEHWDVKDAVNKYVKDHNIRPWFLIGLNAKISGMIRDNSRSWMWVKQ